MIKVALSQDSMLQMAMNALTISNAQLQIIKRKFMDATRAVESEAHYHARTRLSRTAQQYADAISYQQTSENVAELKLDASASHLENGYGAFDMVPGMLKSQAIVKTGKRAGQPWVRISKEGYRYAVVPFIHSPAPAMPGHPLNKAPVQIGQPTQTTMGNLAADLQKLQALTKGRNVGGQSGRFTNNGDLWTFLASGGRARSANIPGIHPILQGMVKQTAQVGKKNVSQYNTFRVVTENPNRTARWRHPGFAGVHIFKDLETFMRNEMEKIVRETLGGP